MPWSIILAVAFAHGMTLECLLETKNQKKIEFNSSASAAELEAVTAEDYYNRGVNFLDEGKYDRSLEDYEKAIAAYERAVEKLTPMIPSFGFLKPIHSYDRAIEINTDNALAWFNHGLTLVNLSGFDKAIDSYN